MLNSNNTHTYLQPIREAIPEILALARRIRGEDNSVKVSKNYIEKTSHGKAVAGDSILHVVKFTVKSGRDYAFWGQ